METQWGAWLAAEMGAGRGGIVWPDPIVRGTEFKIELPIPADVSGDAFAASVGLSPGVAPLVNFAVTVGSYAAGITLVTLTLSATDTLLAGAEDGDGDGLAEVVCDVLYLPAAGGALRATAFVIPVSGAVTEVPA